MNWLKMNLLVLVSSMFLTACVAGTEPEEFEDVTSAAEDTAEAESPIIYIGNHCEDGYCYTYRWECNGDVCRLTIIDMH